MMKHPFISKKSNKAFYIILAAVLLFEAIISMRAIKANSYNVERMRRKHYVNMVDEQGAGDVFLPIVSNGVAQTPPGNGGDYFISPSGNDDHDGRSPGQAWATFEHAWTKLQPGDTLTLLDGVYYQSIHPQNVGEIGNQVTVRAQNDGKAIIDGEDQRIPVRIEKYRRSYLIIEGIVARNGNRDVYSLTGDHNILRRVSGYDAYTDGNSRVFSVGGQHNLLEDCVAAGSARKMIVTLGGQYNTVRRCHADWREWNGREWHGCWPQGLGIEMYTASNNIFENSIAYGQVAGTGIEVMAQGGAASRDNKILGSMAIQSGMNFDGTPIIWGDTRPQPSIGTCIAKIYEWPNMMSGFMAVASGGTLHDNLLQDILAWGNARYGIAGSAEDHPDTDVANNQLNRATIIGNGLNNPHREWGGNGVDTSSGVLSIFASVTDSYIENIWQGGSDYTTMTGEGARLTRRYVDGVMTNEDLWPWPMEERVKDELGYSVTCRMGSIINDAYAAGKAAEGIDMTTRDPDWANDPNNLVVQACNN